MTLSIIFFLKSSTKGLSMGKGNSKSKMEDQCWEPKGPCSVMEKKIFVGGY